MSTPFSHFSAKINQFSPQEYDFTEVLSTIALKPKTLYFYGKIPQNVAKSPHSNPTKEAKLQHNQVDKSSSKTRTERPKVVAIVGSRHNTRYGQEIAYKLAYELAKNGIIVVSGLAYGIDSIAHRGCLAAGGTTIAVLGTRIDDIYPKEHVALAREIIERDGAIISEYAPADTLNAPLAPAEVGWNGTSWVDYAAETPNSLEVSDDTKAPDDSPSRLCRISRSPYQKREINRKMSFLYRNRLISGLADAVVIVEAAEKSGSLNTAAHALEQGKDVFAVPGNITSPYSQGCNKLIKQGAIPYTEPRDVLELLSPEHYIQHHKRLKKQHLIGDNDVETKILQAIASGLRSGEEIMANTHLPPEVFNQTPTLLEIKSRLRPLGANHWGLA